MTAQVETPELEQKVHLCVAEALRPLLPVSISGLWV